MAGCNVNEIYVNGLKAVVIENELLKITVLADKGADIYEFLYKPKNIDVLWKSPRGVKNNNKGITTASDSKVAWMENYEGGWQEIFPNGGGPCDYKGVEMNFHGEACTLPWEYKIEINQKDRVCVTFSVSTFRSPFRLERSLTLRTNDARMYLDEKITNESDETMDYMWGNHPAFGSPFMDEGVILDVPGTWLQSQKHEDDMTRLAGSTHFDWPRVEDKHGNSIDLSYIPNKEQRSADLAFIGGLSGGWYGITNPKLQMGFGLVWPKEIFPYLWLWQEFRGSKGWPWYSSNYVMALEPFTSFDESGLTNCIKNGTARVLQPWESIEISLIALCYEASKGIHCIDKFGNVNVRE